MLDELLKSHLYVSVWNTTFDNPDRNDSHMSSRRLLIPKFLTIMELEQGIFDNYAIPHRLWDNCPQSKGVTGDSMSPEMYNQDGQLLDTTNETRKVGDLNLPDLSEIHIFLRRSLEPIHPLHLMAKYITDPDNIRNIIKSWIADVGLDVRDDRNSTPLIYASSVNNLNAVKILLRFGANPSATTLSGSYNSLHFAAMRNYDDIVKELLLTEIDPIAINANKSTALSLATNETTKNIIKNAISSLPRKRSLSVGAKPKYVIQSLMILPNKQIIVLPNTRDYIYR